MAMANTRNKSSPTKRKAVATSSAPVPLWTTCIFTFNTPRKAFSSEPAIQTCALWPVQLPQELVDYIVDFLHDDVRSLISCSLVSHSFIPGSRLHLFGTFYVRDDRTLSGLLNPSPYATARHAIRTLCLGTTSVIEKRSPLKVTFASLENLVLQLPMLSNFYLLNISLDCSRLPLSSSLEGRTAKAIRYLWLYKVVDAVTRRPLPPHELFPILRLFTAIETLNFSCGFERRPSFVVPDDTTYIQRDGTLPPLQIQSLRFCSSPAAAPLMQAIRQTSAAHSLQSLEVCAQDRETLVALGELLHSVRHHINELTVDCRRRNSLHILKDADTMCQALNLSENLQGASALRTMNFKLHMSHEDIPILDWHWKFVLGLVSEAAKVAPNITSCAFMITLAGYYPLKTLETANWQTLDKGLKQMPSLRRIYVGARNSSPFDWSKADQKKRNQALNDVFANMLPDWKAKGALFPLEH